MSFLRRQKSRVKSQYIILNTRLVKKSLPDLTEWFGFKSKEYTIDPKNPEIMAFNKDFANDLVRRSEQAIISETAPKFVLLELSGDGKTHAMNYALNQLQKNGLIERVYFVCPSMTSGSKYSVLHAMIISHMHEKDLILPTLKKVFHETSTQETEDWIKKLEKKHGLHHGVDKEILLDIFVEMLNRRLKCH